MGFALAVGTSLYLSFVNPNWPLDEPPDLLFPTVVTVLLVASTVPNFVLDRQPGRRIAAPSSSGSPSSR